MRKQLTVIACISALALAGGSCTREERMIAGGLAGAGAGFFAASVFNANPAWTMLAVAAGAAAGTLVARNTETGMCAYARGDGTFYEAPCP